MTVAALPITIGGLGTREAMAVYFFSKLGIEESVALGNLRLTVIDLEHGHQPLRSADGRFVVVYNGEVFNYLELRKELEEVGVEFQTATDTEVLLNGFGRYGPPFLDLLDGMYAFLIFDREKRELHAGRDPFGIKPLFGCQRDGCQCDGWEKEIKKLKRAGAIEVNELREKKHALESQIKELLAVFQNETGLNVNNVSLNTMTDFSKNKVKVLDVSVGVSL